MDVLGYACAALALLGNVFVIQKRRAGFLCWIVANVGLIAYNTHLGAWPQVGLFSCYLVLAVWGWVKWKG